MIPIHYPEVDFKIEKRNGLPFIFDSIRKKWLLLQDEEWVRQNFIQYLLKVMQYPQSLLALEKEILLGDLKKRFDILVYNGNHQPWMLVECKAAHIPLNENTLAQVLRYNISLPAQYLIITNGNTTYGWEKTDNSLQEIHSLPEFGTHY